MKYARLMGSKCDEIVSGGTLKAAAAAAERGTTELLHIKYETKQLTVSRPGRRPNARARSTKKSIVRMPRRSPCSGCGRVSCSVPKKPTTRCARSHKSTALTSVSGTATTVKPPGHSSQEQNMRPDPGAACSSCK